MKYVFEVTGVEIFRDTCMDRSIGLFKNIVDAQLCMRYHRRADMQHWLKVYMEDKLKGDTKANSFLQFWRWVRCETTQFSVVERIIHNEWKNRG